MDDAPVDRLAAAIEAQTDLLRSMMPKRESSRVRLKPLKRMSAISFVEGIPGLRERVRRVPSGAVEADGDELLVTCPCGGHPVVETVLAECPGDCGRWYIGRAGHAFVIYGDMEMPVAG